MGNFAVPDLVILAARVRRQKGGLVLLSLGCNCFSLSGDQVVNLLETNNVTASKSNVVFPMSMLIAHHPLVERED